MKKKDYIKPEMNVYQMETQAILAGSGETTNTSFATDEDYDSDNMNNYIDGFGTIGAD